MVDISSPLIAPIALGMGATLAWPMHPMLLMTHVVGTRIAESVLDVHNNYKTVLIAQWVVFPWLGVVQAIAVLTVWTHACIGVHFWLRTKPWYPGWRPFLFGFGLLLPTLALAGFVAAGNEVLRGAKNPDYVRFSLQASNLTNQKRFELAQLVRLGITYSSCVGSAAICRARRA